MPRSRPVDFTCVLLSVTDWKGSAETGRRPESLEDLTGVGFADLDQQYGEYVLKISKSLKEEIATLPNR